MTGKTCIHCGIFKDLRQFYVAKSNKDGRDNRCKLCCRAVSARRREERREEVSAYFRARYKDPVVSAARMAYHKAYLKTERGRASRRVTQRIYRAYRRAIGAQPFPSERPEAVTARRNRGLTASSGAPAST